MKGMIGQFLFEFGVSVAVAVLVSLFVALTLTPMLCSRMLRVRPKHGRVYEFLERGFRWLERSYARALDLVLRHKILTLVATTVVLVVALVVLVPVIGGEFAGTSERTTRRKKDTHRHLQLWCRTGRDHVHLSQRRTDQGLP